MSDTCRFRPSAPVPIVFCAACWLPLIWFAGFEITIDHPHTDVVRCSQLVRGMDVSIFLPVNYLPCFAFCWSDQLCRPISLILWSTPMSPISDVIVSGRSFRCIDPRLFWWLGDRAPNINATKNVKHTIKPTRRDLICFNQNRQVPFVKCVFPTSLWRFYSSCEYERYVKVM